MTREEAIQAMLNGHKVTNGVSTHWYDKDKAGFPFREVYDYCEGEAQLSSLNNYENWSIVEDEKAEVLND